MSLERSPAVLRRLRLALCLFAASALAGPMASVALLAAPLVFVASQKIGDGTVQDFNGTLTIVSATTLEVVGSPITVGPIPVAVVAPKPSERAYVLNKHHSGSGTLSVVSTGVGAVVATIVVGERPVAMAITPDERTAFVGYEMSSHVSVVDLPTNTVTRELESLGVGPISPDGRTMYVNWDDWSIRELDTRTLAVRARAIPVSAFGIVPSPDGKLLYLSNHSIPSPFNAPRASGSTVAVLDLASNDLIATIAVGPMPGPMAVSPDGRHLYIANTGDETISIVDTAARKEIGRFPAAVRTLTPSPDGTHLFVTAPNSVTARMYDVTNGVVGGWFGISLPGHVPMATAARDQVLPGAEHATPLRAFAVEPRVPDANDHVTVSYFGSGPGISTHSHSISGQRISVVLVQDGTDARPNPFFVFREEIGRLAPGAYEVEIALKSQGAIDLVVTGSLRIAAASAPTVDRAVEYYHPALDHYFVTSSVDEMFKLDSGVYKGWQRTGEAFDVHRSATPDTVVVCRYYIMPAWGDSHFLSASRDECDGLRLDNYIRTWTGYFGAPPRYFPESGQAFYLAVPTPDGICPAGRVPVYRLWNARVDSNHRYTIDAGTKAQMMAKGYVAEGYGPHAVAMCAPVAG